MASWGLLDEKDESELHKIRLLNVEEKPFKRIAKRVGTVSMLVPKVTEPQSPDQNGAPPLQKSSIEQLKEDFVLDFAAFDSSITRLQFLLNANTRECARYRTDQQRIMEECQAVRDNNAQLREQLESSKATLAQRKEFDKLAEKITSQKLLRPREDQIVNLAALEEECSELERESQTYSETWNERKNQFNRIMEEGMQLRRQIRDEKEEVDRREGMNEGGEDDDDGDKGGRTPRPETRPDGETQSKVGGEVGTPRPHPEDGGATPQRDTPGAESLKPMPGQAGSHPQTGNRNASREVSPAAETEEQKGESGEDVEMEDPAHSGTNADEGGGETPRDADTPRGQDDTMEVDN